jgi:hypothetical protein
MRLRTPFGNATKQFKGRIESLSLPFAVRLLPGRGDKIAIVAVFKPQKSPT